MYLLGRTLRALAHGDAEEAHGLGIKLADFIQNRPRLLRAIAWWYEADKVKPYKVFGITFPNRIGWAGGYDKNAQTILLSQALGFGFGDVGTVLPRPQAGNERPRYFYLPKDRALINRFGFNSRGADAVDANLRRIRPFVRIPLGINMGKMKNTPNEQAVEDYLAVWRKLRMHGKFGVANISSPNTPGLRDLQGGRYLEDFVTRLVNFERDTSVEWHTAAKPVLVKLAPDLTDAEMHESLESCERGGAAGIIIGNTTTTRPATLESAQRNEQGGLSGDPLYRIMMSRFRLARKLTKLPLVAAGGIDNAAKARAMFDEGADLLEIYSGFVYQGPQLVSKLRAVA